ncbi:glycosyltransferase family 61 protein [Rickettsia endosymbiont of Rhinocyllus conicus]|uniref:glycosyltransferase family 61 protein n=1 Tax=Rickettsia endosymbiont of Rhinocyllus conicus TaxID=3066252 RepID=UPI003132A8C4
MLNFTKYFIFIVFYFFYTSNIYAINNNHQFIAVESLESPNIKIKKLLEEKNTSQFILELPNGVVINEGGVLTEEGYILQDTQTSTGDQHRLVNKKRDINEENPLYFKGKLAVISSPGSENWYHWLLQVLPRLIILKESNFEYDRIYVNNLKYQWQIKSLEVVLNYLNISEDKLLVVNSDCIIQASNLIVPSVPFIPVKGTALPFWLKKDLRNIFLKNNKDDIKTYDKIYISRKYASSRKIINEEKLIEEIEKIGFKVIYLELLSPHEQAQIFNKAKIIIGIHGSGFANLIFATPKCKVVEIDHGTNPPRSFYKRMANYMSCDYYPYYVDQTTEEHLEDDIKIDINKFMKFFNELDK